MISIDITNTNRFIIQNIWQNWTRMLFFICELSMYMYMYMYSAIATIMSLGSLWLREFSFEASD